MDNVEVAKYESSFVANIIIIIIIVRNPVWGIGRQSGPSSHLIYDKRDVVLNIL